MASDDRLAAVLFDMDGTLVDSEKVWSVGLTELAGHYGTSLSDDARRAMVGTVRPMDWAVFGAVVLLSLLLDRAVFGGPKATVSFREASIRSIFFVCVGLGFSGYVMGARSLAYVLWPVSIGVGSMRCFVF